MATNVLGDLLGKISVQVGGDYASGRPIDRSPILGTAEKVMLAAAAVVAYALCHTAFHVTGLPAVPGISSLLTQDQPFYTILVVAIVYPLVTFVMRAFVGRIEFDAPLFCAALGLLALPTHGGDTRNALLDGGGSAYVRMMIEQALLAGVLVLAYACLVRRPATDAVDAVSGEADVEDAATPADRLLTVLSQSAVTLALLWAIGQSPAKGQAMLGVALAGGSSGFMLYKSRPVRGSVWYVAGTLLAGLVAYGWNALHPAGAALGDAVGLLAGPARVLPLHYATAGVAGTIYGYWAGRAGTEEMVQIS